MTRKDQEYRHGWLLEHANGQFVESIVSNGHPDSPIVYYTRDPQEAQGFSRFSAVEQRALQLGLMIRKFDTEDRGPAYRLKRILGGYE